MRLSFFFPLAMVLFFLSLSIIQIQVKSFSTPTPSPSPSPSSATSPSPSSSSKKTSSTSSSSSSSSSYSSTSSSSSVSVESHDSVAFTPVPSASLTIFHHLPSLFAAMSHPPIYLCEWSIRGTVDITFSPSSSSSSPSSPSGIKFSPFRVNISSSSSTEDKDRFTANKFERLYDSNIPTPCSSAYEIQFAQNDNNNNSNENVALSSPFPSSPSCSLALNSLLSANFRENFIFHFSPNGILSAVECAVEGENDILATESETPKRLSPDSLPPSLIFSPRAKISFGRTGAQPQLVRMRQYGGAQTAFQDGQGGEGSGKKDGTGTAEEKEKEQQSFFQKYWMYIVPIGVVMLINGLTSGAEQGQGQGQGQTQAAAPRS